MLFQRQLGFLALALLWGVGCAPEIGDECENSADCSVNGDRICDIAQPSGYCTVRACDPDTCPEEATCVEWRFQPDRTAETYCMKRCAEGDCRPGYACFAQNDPMLADATNPGQSIARVVDLDRDAETTMFCVAVE